MEYLRMPRNKFWTWVVVSLLAGLGVGLGIMFWSSAGTTTRIASLEARLSGASSDASVAVAAAEASVAALTTQITQLTADLAAAQAQIAVPQVDPATETPTEETATIAVTSRTITPISVAASGTITMTAKVTGGPDKVTMRVYTASKSFDKTYTLKKISTSGDTETWRLAVKGPATVGTYRYFATAISGSTRVTMPGATPKSFTVK